MGEAVAQLLDTSPLHGEALVAAENITKRYGPRVVLERLSLTLRAGDVFGLVGENGCGKTTTLRILAGILKPEQGHGQILGHDLQKDRSEIRRHVGYMSQRLSLYTDLSVFENLRFRADVYGLDNPSRAADSTIEDFQLDEYARTPAGSLSGGWARKLQFAAALVHSPKLILLDEPTAGLDALSRHEVWKRIERLAADGAGVIVSTHDLAEAERCSFAMLLSEGRTAAAGTTDQIARKAPAAAFLVTGANARLFAHSVEEVPGVIASSARGPALRVVAAPEAEKSLHRLASSHGVSIVSVQMGLEDAVLAFARR